VVVPSSRSDLALNAPSDAEREARGDLLFGRFEVLSELGSGAFGRVVCCRDRDSGEETALKELHHFSADALLRFKNEFRSLSDVQHPNLVRLGELLEGEGHWAFTLEYVPGTDVLGWVRERADERGFHETRLRDVLVQLVHGLMGIHTLGLLHRDVKPQNVRVTPSGRVVLLDFGLVTHLAQGKQASEAHGAGTVAYMAPEQAHEERLGPSADWYALGVLLYEMLTGCLPFEGSAFHIMLSKQQGLPKSPASIEPGVPADLDALCMGLLATHPAHRLDGEALLLELSKAAGTSLPPPTFVTRNEEPFVGRELELGQLRERFLRATQHGIQLVLVEGESGIGKSALVERMADDLTDRDSQVLVLRGRCHAAEQLGYKAFDGAVDELSRHLRALSDEECSAFLPVDAQLLPVLFPVLSRVSAIAHAQQLGDAGKVERYPLFAAFIELLLRLSRERMLVMVVDDLQWADEASLVLLKTLLDSSRAPRLLIVGTVRPLAGLEDAVGEGLRGLAQHERASILTVGPLAEGEACALAARLTGDAVDGHVTRLLALESGGHPLFVTELARHSSSRDAFAPKVVDLDAAILQRVDALPVAARLLLEQLCVASGPLPQSVLRNALGASADATQPLVATLRAQRLVRTARRGEIVSYHDRMREAVLGAIDPGTVAAHHRKLARAWEAHPSAAPARVAQHWLGCGEHERAIPWLEQAAERAEQGGAFERAVEHYRSLLALPASTFASADRHTTKLCLAEALAGAGRCAESAREVLEALDGATEAEAPELALRAAQRLLQAGKVEEGLSAAKQAFELLGVGWPAARVSVAMRLAYNRAAIALRGFDVQAIPDGVAERERIELEAIKRLVLPMAWADFLRDAELVSRHTLLALRARDPGHLAYALSTEACMRAIQHGEPEQTRVLFAKGAAFREKASSPELEAHAAYMQGTAATFRGDFAEAVDHLETAHDLYRTKCPGAAWEITNVRGVLLNIWSVIGRFEHHAERAQEWIDEAVARGDAFARATYVVTGFGCHRALMRDLPAVSLAEIADAMVPWESDTVGFQHFTQVFATAWGRSYQASSDAHVLWASAWPRLRKSFLYRMPFMREGLVATCLMTLLASVSQAGDYASVKDEARALSRMVRNPRSVAGRSFGALVQAQAAWINGDREAAAELARLSIRESERTGTWYVHCAEIMLARARGAADARDRQLRAEDWFARQGWQNPERAVCLILPVARSWG